MSYFPMLLFSFFGLSSLISKSAFTLLYIIAVFFGLYQFKWSLFPKLSTLEKGMILLFPFAIIVNFFSIGGKAAAINVFLQWTWPLIYFPIHYLSQHQKERQIFYKSLAGSLILACLYSYFRFYNEFNFFYDTKNRVSSFWDILRWAYFCSIAVVILLSLLMKKNFLDIKTWRILFILFLMSLTSLVLTNSRGAWFGALFGMLIAIIVQKKSIKYYLGYASLIVMLLLSSEGVRSRLFSSFSIKKNGTQITSEDGSNAGRLHMWKVALDLYQQVPIFGVGFNNSKSAIENFLITQDQDYIQKYTTIEYSYTDQHSSYVGILLQFGGLFFLVLYLFFALVTVTNLKDQVFMPALMCTYVVYFFYAGIVSFEAVIIFGLSAFLISKKPSEEFQ